MSTCLRARGVAFDLSAQYSVSRKSNTAWGVSRDSAELRSIRRPLDREWTETRSARCAQPGLLPDPASEPVIRWLTSRDGSNITDKHAVLYTVHLASRTLGACTL